MLEQIYSYTLLPIVTAFKLWRFLVFYDDIFSNYSYFWNMLDWRNIP